MGFRNSLWSLDLVGFRRWFEASIFYCADNFDALSCILRSIFRYKQLRVVEDELWIRQEHWFLDWVRDTDERRKLYLQRRWSVLYRQFGRPSEMRPWVLDTV